MTRFKPSKLQGFVMTTLNKLPQVKPDLVRVDESWEEWSMEDLIDALQKWLRRNHVESSKFCSHRSKETSLSPIAFSAENKSTGVKTVPW